MDCQMPVMDGFVATRTIRASGASYADIPIIALTASAQPEHLARCEAVGMNDHLTKPLNAGALERVLGMMLRDAPEAATAPPTPANDPGEAIRRDLVEMMGPASVRSLLAILLAQLDGRFNPADDVTTMREDAHALAGSAGLMGFLDLSNACRALETAIVDGRDHGPALDLTRGLVARTIGLARRWDEDLTVAEAPARRFMH
jgi:CheY-like chemotaxis protein